MAVNKKIIEEILFEKLGFDDKIKQYDAVDALCEFFDKRQWDENTAYKFLWAIRKRDIIAKADQGYMHASINKELIKNLEALDGFSYEKISEIDRKFKEVYRNNHIKRKKMDILFREVARAVKKYNDATNVDLYDYTNEQLDEIYQVASLYSVLTKTLGTDLDKKGNGQADKIILKLAQSIKKNDKPIINEERIYEIEEMIKAFQSPVSGLSDTEVFSNKELKQILQKTTSLLCASNAHKVNSIRLLLNGYLESLIELADKENKTEEKEILINTSVKSIVLKAGTLLKGSVNSAKESIDLLMGNKLGDSVRGGSKLSKEELRETEEGRLLSGCYISGYDLNKHILLIKKQPTTITQLSASGFYSIEKQLVEGIANGLIDDASKLTFVEKWQELKKRGINPECLVHADNLSSLIKKPLGKEQGREFFVKNIQQLYDILPGTDIQKLVMHNLALLCQPPELLNAEIRGIITENKNDLNKCKQALEQFVNSKFHIKLTEQKTNSAKVEDEDGGPEQDIDIEDDREYVELDISKLEKLKKQLDLANRHGEPKTSAPKVTKENYHDLLDNELESLTRHLQKYGGSMLEKPTVKYEAMAVNGTVGNLLMNMHSGKAPQSIIDQVPSRLRALRKMVELFKSDENFDINMADKISKLKGNIENYSAGSLDTRINDTTNLADCYTDEVRQPRNLGILRERKDLLEEKKSTLLRLKSESSKWKDPAVKEMKEKDLRTVEADVEKLIYDVETLESKYAKVKETKQFATEFYADRADLLVEQETLEIIAKMFDGITTKYEDKESKEEDEGQIKQNPELEARKSELREEISKKERAYRTNYRTPDAKRGSAAKKLNKDIDKLKQELNDLESNDFLGY